MRASSAPEWPTHRQRKRSRRSKLAWLRRDRRRARRRGEVLETLALRDESAP